MATTRRELVFVTFIFSCISLALLITSVSTKMWVVSDLKPKDTSILDLSNYANYGLFTGTYEKKISATNIRSEEITLTCIMSENICAWSCQPTPELRELEVLSLLSNGMAFSNCLGDIGTAVPGDSADKRFINAGLWVSTLLFLVLALLTTFVAALLAVYNTTANPRSSVLAVEGLYYWNGAAAGMDLVCLVLWGGQFGSVLSENVALADVIAGTFDNEGAALGYSYWLIFGAMLSSMASIAALAYREYMIRKKPPPPTFKPEDAQTDGVIFLY